MSDWKPIETAPRDGTPVLLIGWVEGVLVGEMRWSLPVVTRYLIRSRSGQFRKEHTRWLNWIHRHAPTHWQPLPAPPTPTTGEPA